MRMTKGVGVLGASVSDFRVRATVLRLCLKYAEIFDSVHPSAPDNFVITDASSFVCFSLGYAVTVSWKPALIQMSAMSGSGIPGSRELLTS